MKYFLTLLLLINPIAFAQCPDDIQEVKKGDIVNCDGLLFSEKASRDVNDKIEDGKYYKDLSELLVKRSDLANKEIDVLTKRLDLYITQSEVFAKELTYKENEDKWQKMIYFGLGVLATGVAVYGASNLK